MKAKIRIPTRDPYAFIELDAEGTLEEINDTYHEMTSLHAVGGGLEPKEWNKALDTYLSTNELESDTYERMSANQKGLIQEIKRAFKRLEYKNK